MSIIHNLHTRQVDFVNAFAQADLKTPVFVEIPKGYVDYNDEACCLQLNKSLYGLCDASLNFFSLLSSNLRNHGFKQLSYIDPCLFVHEKTLCVTYVDDCLWVSLDEKFLDDMIAAIGTKMELTVESKDISAFLGIQFTRRNNTIELTQKGLIDKVLDAAGMSDCNG